MGPSDMFGELSIFDPGTKPVVLTGAQRSFDHPKKTALFNSGAEDVENAVEIARNYTGKRGVVVMARAFHGRTNLTMAMTAKQSPYKNGFGRRGP